MTQPFTLHGYGELLDHLGDLGYVRVPSDVRYKGERIVYLQHDVDIHIEGALDIADIEESRGIHSCWYVATHLEYNPGSEHNMKILRALVYRGHSIGLHYMAGQSAPEIAADRLFLERIVNTRVRSHVMHRPSGGGFDNLLHDDNNPFNLCEGYISDSRMQWTGGRIEKLLAGEGPDQVRLCTHHEHWLGNGRYNTTYIKMIDVVERSHREYIIDLMEG